MASNNAAAGLSGLLPVHSSSPDVGSFDIVATYHRLLAEDPELTMPMATIEALIAALGASSATTVFETMKLVEAQSDRLRQSPRVANPMAVRHGSDFFKQYLVRELRQLPSSGGTAGGGGSGSQNTDQQFDAIRKHLQRNAHLFATRAKEAREKIAYEGRFLIKDDWTILTHGGSRVVSLLLQRAKERVNGDNPRRFKVIYAISESRQEQSNEVVKALRAKNIAVATISEGAVAHVMSKVNMVLVGAEVITAQGGIISRMGTYQIAEMAKIKNKPFYVAAEQHKLGQTFPTDQFTIEPGKFRQNPLRFERACTRIRPGEEESEDEKLAREVRAAAPLDFTPPTLIESFICDHGIKSTVALEHQAIDMFVE
ncbi:translation initiation factor eIF-2B alpha subunit [Nemania sp. FL0916]|nr:translation initiation factor eIF-2B alpha subunit [Nemania sp. FL0916]